MWACGCADTRAGAPAWGCICLRVQSPLRTHRCVHHAHACVCACMHGDFLWLRPVRPHVRPSSPGGRGQHARAVRGRRIDFTKVTALPESLGRCKLLETLCVPRPPPRRLALLRVRAAPGAGAGRAALEAAAAAAPVVGRGRAHARMLGARGRPARVRGGPEPPWAAARLSRRSAADSELAALPVAADWPNLKTL